MQIIPRARPPAAPRLERKQPELPEPGGDRPACLSLPPVIHDRLAQQLVSAVNSTFTLCCAITRQNAPASGVPTGLPSYITDVQPRISGA